MIFFQKIALFFTRKYNWVKSARKTHTTPIQPQIMMNSTSIEEMNLTNSPMGMPQKVSVSMDPILELADLLLNDINKTRVMYTTSDLTNNVHLMKEYNADCPKQMLEFLFVLVDDFDNANGINVESDHKKQLIDFLLDIIIACQKKYYSPYRMDVFYGHLSHPNLMISCRHTFIQRYFGLFKNDEEVAIKMLAVGFFYMRKLVLEFNFGVDVRNFTTILLGCICLANKFVLDDLYSQPTFAQLWCNGGDEQLQNMPAPQRKSIITGHLNHIERFLLNGLQIIPTHLSAAQKCFYGYYCAAEPGDTEDMLQTDDNGYRYGEIDRSEPNGILMTTMLECDATVVMTRNIESCIRIILYKTDYVF